MKIEKRAFTVAELEIISAANDAGHRLEANLKDLIAEWRDYAYGSYCQTYNQGMAEGLLRAADDLQGVLLDA